METGSFTLKGPAKKLAALVRLAGIHLLVLVAAPWVAWWVWRQERRGLRSGTPLPENLAQFAGWLGIREVSRIRLVTGQRVPFPGTPWMQKQAAKLGFDGSTVGGLCLRYAIFLTESAAAQGDATIRHELVHTLQYERCGSILRFLRRYLTECLRDGYSGAALELEAQQRSWPAPPEFR